MPSSRMAPESSARAGGGAFGRPCLFETSVRRIGTISTRTSRPWRLSTAMRRSSARVLVPRRTARRSGPASPRWRGTCPRCVWRVAASRPSRASSTRRRTRTRESSARRPSSSARRGTFAAASRTTARWVNASAWRPRRARHEPPSRDSNPTASSRSPSRTRTTAQTVTARSRSDGAARRCPR